jgi:hypothetical protein
MKEMNNITQNQCILCTLLWQCVASQFSHLQENIKFIESTEFNCIKRYYKLRYQLFMSYSTMVYHTFYEFYITVLKMDKVGKNTLHNKLCNMYRLCMMVANSFIISINTMGLQT